MGCSTRDKDIETQVGSEYGAKNISENEREIEIKKEYFPDGKLESETPYRNGKKEGAMKAYYNSGKLYCEISYKDNKQEGTQKYYHHTSGKLMGEIFIKDGEPDGVWKYYDENESLIKEITYKNGQKIGIREVR